MADTASFSAAMKTKFIGPIRDNLAKGKPLLFGGDEGNPTGFQGIKRSAEGIKFEGNEFRIPLKTVRNPAVGFRSEGEVLPAPGASGYTYLSEPMRYAYALFNITGQLLKASEQDAGAFKQAFKAEMEDTLLSSKLDHNRAAFGNGSGVLATQRNNEAAAQTVIDVDTTINFRGGEVIDGVTIATGVVIEPARTVTAVDRANRTITVSPALTTGLTATSDGWVRSSSDSTVGTPNNSYNKEILGLDAIIKGSATLHGVNPATVTWWKSYVDSSGGPVSDAKLRGAFDEVGFESGVDQAGDAKFALIGTRGIRRRYAETLVSAKQFTNAEALHLRGGFTALDFDGQPFFIDDSCQLGRVYGISLADLFWADMSDWEWIDDDGSVLKWESRRHRFIAILYKFTQLGTTARNRHFLVSGLTDDVK